MLKTVKERARAAHAPLAERVAAALRATREAHASLEELRDVGGEINLGFALDAEALERLVVFLEELPALVDRGSQAVSASVRRRMQRLAARDRRSMADEVAALLEEGLAARRRRPAPIAVERSVRA